MDRNKGLSTYTKPSEAEIIFPNVSMRVFHGAGTNDEEKTLPSSGGYISVQLVS